MFDEFLKYGGFTQNKYFHLYFALAKKIYAENRTYNREFYENHHVLPDCFGGTFMLPYTFREHFVAHKLLTKFTNGVDKAKMTYAVHTFFHMRNSSVELMKTNSYKYEHHKKEFIKTQTESYRGAKNPRTDKTVYSFRNMNTGETHICTRSELKTKNTGLTPYDINVLARVYKSNTKMHAKGWGVYLPELEMYSYELTSPKVIPNKVTCEHCRKHISQANYSRWHGENCKSVDPEGHSLRVKQVASINGKSPTDPSLRSASAHLVSE